MYFYIYLLKDIGDDSLPDLHLITYIYLHTSFQYLFFGQTMYFECQVVKHIQ